jgi:hypothetical protein
MAYGPTVAVRAVCPGEFDCRVHELGGVLLFRAHVKAECGQLTHTIGTAG